MSQDTTECKNTKLSLNDTTSAWPRCYISLAKGAKTLRQYYGVIQSVIRLGHRAYQVTVRIYNADEESRCAAEQEEDKLPVVYRANIVLDDNEPVLFPDRELSRCLDAPHSYDKYEPRILRRQRMTGEIAEKICTRLAALLIAHDKPAVSQSNINCSQYDSK